LLGLLAAWLWYPAVALLVSLGLGLLTERAAGFRLPGVLVLPVGMAGIVVVTQLTTYRSPTAELTLPLLVIGAGAGLWLGRERLRGLKLDRWAAGAFAAVLALYGAPVLLSGHATFLGYTILGDTSIHMIGADALLRYGREFESLAPSSYEYSLVAYYGANAYPSGGPTAAGALTSLAGLDVAWTFQVFLSLLSALMALCLYSLARPLVESAPLRAAVAALAAVPALSVAYAWQGSVKEVGTAFGVLLAAALVQVYVGERGGSVRRAIPLGVAAGATIGIVGPAAVVWLGPLALGAFVLAGFPWRHIPVFVAIAAVAGFQMLLDLVTYVDVSGTVVTAQQEFGNLLGPLDRLEALGIWLTGDYRVPVTDHRTLNHLLMALVALAGAAGIVHVVRRRAWGTGLFLGVSVIACAYVVHKGSPWADGKALMIVSPAVMFAALVGAASIPRAAPVIVGVIAAGLLWTNALQYHDASPAPADRFTELAEVGGRIDGEGPTLYPEFEEFAKHFLRRGDPEGTGEGWQRRFNLSGGQDGTTPRFGFAQDLDFFTPEYVAYYRTIVLRRGFQTSRPPAAYRRTYTGRFYEVWQRAAGPPPSFERVRAGVNRAVAGAPDCAAVKSLAAGGGELSFLERPADVVFSPAAVKPLPGGWSVDAVDPATVILAGAGTITGKLEVPTAGRYDLWVDGTDRRDWPVTIDGKSAGTALGRLNSRGVADRVGTLSLAAGPHEVKLTRPAGSLAPGSGGRQRLLGPVVLTVADPGGLPVKKIPASRYEELCGKSVDWVEAAR
jgi:hypothetical protein